MNLQKLRDKFSDVGNSISSRIERTTEYLSHPLNLFRFLALLAVLDFFAFMSLTRSSYFQLLNPAFFLGIERGESRDSMELLFPRSISLTGLDRIYPEETLQGSAVPVKENTEKEKALDEKALAKDTILIHKKVLEPTTELSERTLGKEEALARRVMLELIAGPGGAQDMLKARYLLKDPLFFHSVWMYEGRLYVSTEKKVWEHLNPNERKLTEYCIIESLKRNLPQTPVVLLKA